MRVPRQGTVTTVNTSARQLLFTGLALLTLLFAPFERHSTLVLHSGLGAPDSIAVDASHADQFAHFETSETLLIPHCAACTQRVRNNATLWRHFHRAPKQEEAGSSILEHGLPKLNSIFRDSSPRAPPLA